MGHVCQGEKTASSEMGGDSDAWVHALQGHGTQEFGKATYGDLELLPCANPGQERLGRIQRFHQGKLRKKQDPNAQSVLLCVPLVWRRGYASSPQGELLSKPSGSGSEDSLCHLPH